MGPKKEMEAAARLCRSPDGFPLRLLPRPAPTPHIRDQRLPAHTAAEHTGVHDINVGLTAGRC